MLMKSLSLGRWILFFAIFLVVVAGVRLAYLATQVNETSLSRTLVEAARRHELLTWIDSPWVNARIADVVVGDFPHGKPVSRPTHLVELTKLFGDPPTGCPLDNAGYQLNEGKKYKNYTENRITFTSCGSKISGYLLIPTDSSGQFPAAVVFHSSFTDSIRHLISGTDSRRLPLAVELVERGYVVLAPEIINFGNRAGETILPKGVDGWERWSLAGRMILDSRRALDLLADLDFVDTDSMVAVGHSLGAYSALFLAAFDQRVKAVVASGGFERVSTDPNSKRWSGYLTHLSHEGNSLNFESVYRAIAPRSVFTVTALLDGNLTHPYTVGQIHEAVEEYFPPGQLISRFFVGGHGFPPHLRNQAWDWLAAQTGS